MNVVDSSGWLEYLGGGPNAKRFAPAIEEARELVVPVITLYEVYKRMHQQRGKDAALDAVAAMMEGRVVDLDGAAALSAAEVALKLGLSMADSIVLSAARTYGATLWTQDADFEGIAGVRYVAKR
jgi:predicted nucleic acid-binding protein